MQLTETTPFSALRRTWQPVAIAAELTPGRVTSYRLLDVDRVLARFPDGRLLVAINSQKR